MRLQLHTTLARILHTKWKTVCPSLNPRTRAANIVLRLPGPKTEAKNAKREFECLQLFLDDKIINTITQSTNVYINNIRIKYARLRDCKVTDNEEVKALIGILDVKIFCRCGTTVRAQVLKEYI